MAICSGSVRRDASQYDFSSFACLPLVLTLAALPIRSQTTAQRAQTEFARGVEMQQKGDLQGARQAYEATLKLAPRRVDVLSNLGMVYSQLGQREQAVKCLLEALKMDPQQLGVRFNLGIAYMRGQEFEEASRQLTRVVDAQPQNYPARHLLGLCYLKLQKFDRGISELEAVANGQPANLDATYTLASAYIKANQAQKAEVIVEKLKAYDTAEAHLIVGSYQLTILEYRKALTELTRALALNPNLPDLHAQLAYAYLFTGDQELATRMFEDELTINPQDSNAVALLGCLYRQNGRVEEAAALLNKAHEQRPDDLDIVFQLGLLAQSQGDNQQALKLLQRVEEKRPEDASVHIVLVRLYSKLKRLEDVKREHAIVDRLNAQGKNAPTVKERALFEVVGKPIE